MNRASMKDTETVMQALETLEVKLAYQEDTIDTLNQAIIKQQDIIDKMQLTLDAVIEKLKSSTPSESQINNEIELPPHY